jgi:hypothetical protein
MKNSSKWNFQVCSSLGSKLEKGFDRDRPAYLLIWYDMIHVGIVWILI